MSFDALLREGNNQQARADQDLSAAHQTRRNYLLQLLRGCLDVGTWDDLGIDFVTGRTIMSAEVGEVSCFTELQEHNLIWRLWFMTRLRHVQLRIEVLDADELARTLQYMTLQLEYGLENQAKNRSLVAQALATLRRESGTATLD